MEGMDDQELFKAAMSDEPPAEMPEPEPAKAEPEQSPEQPRDEHGRFAPKAAEAEAQPEPAPAAEQPKPDAEATVPSWRLRELREEREAAAKRAEEAEKRAQAVEAEWRKFLASQPKPEPKPAPDMYAEPEAWQQHLTQQNQSAILQAKLDLSEDWARDKYGDEKVDAAIRWAEQNLAIPERQRLAQTRNPSRELVRMYDERQTLQQIGGDLESYKARLRAELLEDPTFMQEVGARLRGNVQTNNGQDRPVVQIPPSLNKAPGGNLSHDGLSKADMSDEALYAYATR